MFLFNPSKIGIGESSKCINSWGKLKITGCGHLKGFNKEWNNNKVEDNKASF